MDIPQETALRDILNANLSKDATEIINGTGNLGNSGYVLARCSDMQDAQTGIQCSDISFLQLMERIKYMLDETSDKDTDPNSEYLEEIFRVLEKSTGKKVDSAIIEDIIAEYKKRSKHM